MFTHLGGDRVVRDCDIIGFFNLETASIGKATRELFRKMESEGRVENVSFELPRSFTICTHGKNNSKLYISQISSTTLAKRQGTILDNLL